MPVINYLVMQDDYDGLPKVVFESTEPEIAVWTLAKLSEKDGPLVENNILVGGRHHYMVVTFGERK